LYSWVNERILSPFKKIILIIDTFLLKWRKTKNIIKLPFMRGLHKNNQTGTPYSACPAGCTKTG
ncbi:MAG: hypothetical protein KAJ34_06905, partial [Thermodesulfovibrionia bacterium]|nr:hypothetical protein [Thermodesulfovibrionia bacterium]